jgi:hypothetical protein
MPLGLRKSKWEILGEELRDQRTDFTREVVEARQFNRELLIGLEKTCGNLGTTLGLMGEHLQLVSHHLQLMSDEIVAMRGEIHELKDAVNAQTEAIMRLVDRFEDTGGRPPV